MIEKQQWKTGDMPRRVFLAYSRKRGWAVCDPSNLDQDQRAYIAGRIRPGGGALYISDVLAIEELPPVPASAA